MLKLEVYGEKNKENKLRLKLKEETSGNVSLLLVDEAGVRLKSGTLLSINPNGELVMGSEIRADKGLSLDYHGRLRINGE